jgi:hypothetical protein
VCVRACSRRCTSFGALASLRGLDRWGFVVAFLVAPPFPAAIALGAALDAAALGMGAAALLGRELAVVGLVLAI